MAASLSNVRAGLAANLNTVSKLTGYDILPASDPDYPAAFVFGPTSEKSKWKGNYASRAMGGRMEWVLPVALALGDVPWEEGQRDLDAFLAPDGPQSVRRGIEGRLAGGDPTLGCDAALVVVREVEEQSVSNATCVFTVVVWA